MSAIPAASVPAVTAEQMREVDRIMIEDLHIELIQMMENAGRGLADLTVRLFEPGTATVLAGGGGNGGGGLVAARHLANRGVSVRVALSRPPEELGPVPAHQLDILGRMGVPISDRPAGADVIVDTLIGYSLTGSPRGSAAELIGWANDESAPVLSLDVPSGLDATTGGPGSPCMRADATLTLALPKTGLLRAPELVGRLFLGDISVPPSVYVGMGLRMPPLFEDSATVELTLPGDP